MADTEKMLGSQPQKIQPKLRMFAKGSTRVNAVRSDFASSLRIPSRVTKKRLDLPPDQLSQGRCAGPESAGTLKAPSLKATSDDIEVSVFVSRLPKQTRESAATRRVLRRIESTSVDGNLSTATVKLNQLADLAESDSVAFIELGEALKAPDARLVRHRVSRPSLDLRNLPGRDQGGKNVLVGIIDVGGFDFAHEDFLDAQGHTRWQRIWDQGSGMHRPSPGTRHSDLSEWDYGSEIFRSQMNEAIALSKSENLPAWSLEPQSQMSPGSHGTHVASIAAGNRGICRRAYLAGVLISLPEEHSLDRRRSFYDSTRIAHAVDYLHQLAEEIRQEEGLDELPVSINISLGTNGGGHDASNAVSRWIDSALTTPGRSVCVAAGNAGQEQGETPEDTGYIMGRIHTSDRIEARGLESEIEWIVVGNGLVDVSENELEIWYSGSDRFAVSITPPGMPTIGPIDPQEYIQNQRLTDDSFLSVYNELYHPANGANYISIYLSPFLKSNPVVGVRAGIWRVRLHGIEVRNGSYHGWIERDDPRRRGATGEQQFWNFPSFFTAASNVDSSSVSSLACGQRVVSVANFDEAHERINISSSQGPTRDDRPKPDVAAPGTDIVAANGFTGARDSQWISMTGTSMASPYTAGVIGLMLGEQPGLSAAQICGIIQRTSQPLPNRNFSWSDDSGYGVVNPQACVDEARGLSRRRKLNP